MVAIRPMTAFRGGHRHLLRVQNRAERLFLDVLGSAIPELTRVQGGVEHSRRVARPGHGAVAEAGRQTVHAVVGQVVAGVAADQAAFAQPSGLTTNGRELYIADSEVSSIRAVGLVDNLPVRTVCGSGALFGFGDVDGEGDVLPGLRVDARQLLLLAG